MSTCLVSVLLSMLLLPLGCRSAAVAAPSTPGSAPQAAAHPEADSAGVARIDISTGWIGLGIPASASLTLQAQGTGFTGTWLHTEGVSRGSMQQKPAVQGTAAATNDAVSNLVKALAQTCEPQPTLATFGLSAAVLQERAASAQQSLRSDFNYKSASPAQRAAFEREFTDPAQAQRNLEALYRNEHTDDFPSAGVTVTWRDGHTTKADSSSQFPQMLPWQVTGGGRAVCTTYAPALSAAVGALMPEAMLNRQRLSGAYLLSELADQAIFSMGQPHDR